MTDTNMDHVVVLLANDALEATGQSSHAALLLFDAAICVLVSRLGPEESRKVGALIAGQIPDQIETLIAEGRNDG